MAEEAAQTVPAQNTVTFEDICINFTSEEWELLDEDQKRLYCYVQLENFLSASAVGIPICRYHLTNPPEPVKELRVPDELFIALAKTDSVQGNSVPAYGHTMAGENASSEQGISHVRTVRVDPSIPNSNPCDPILKGIMPLASQQIISPGQQPYPYNSCGQALCVSGDPGQIPRQQSGETFSDMEKSQVPAIEGYIHYWSEKDFTSCEDGDGFLASSGLVQYHATHNGELYRSTECEETFHTEQNNERCCKCGEAFGHKDTCTQHQNIRMGEQPYKCNDCGIFFDCISSYSAHQGIHTKGRHFLCAECGKSFVRKSSLVQHQRLHTGEKPYVCAECGKAFSRRSVFVQHLKIHSGERPYLCNVCGKTFSRKDVLSEHQKIHTDRNHYRCDQCGKYFAIHLYLKLHKRIHNATRPHV